MFRINRRGLTLLEMMMALALVSSLLVGMWVVFQAGYGIFHDQLSRTGIKGEAARAFHHLAAELRQATSLTSAAQTNLTLTLDTDGNGADESIQYTWSGTSGAAFNRTADVTTALVKTVNSLSFSYYDSSNSLLAFPVTVSQVKTVAIDLTAAQGDETFELRSQVKLRNL